MTAGDAPAVLPASNVLANFSGEERSILSGFGTFINLKAQQIVVKEGEPQESLYFLMEGLVHAVHKIKGGLAPLGSIRAGEWFGEINIFDPQAATAMCVAHMDSRVWAISRDRLEEFLNSYPSLGCMLLLAVSEILAKRTRGMIKKLNATWEISY